MPELVGTDLEWRKQMRKVHLCPEIVFYDLIRTAILFGKPCNGNPRALFPHPEEREARLEG
jgi:hypothetical protein